MPSTSLNGEVEHWWRGFLRTYLNRVRNAVWRCRSSGTRSIDLWDDNSRLHEAILVLRMAANFRGEDYEVVAARIEKEVARYREFLQQPEFIGKISLIVKRFPLDVEEEDELPRQVYQVREPTEGRASVFYTFNRSDRLVLEFVVHDKHDTPLFPIVRTYSNWTGKRQFNLGLGRTFTLMMAEDESSECVRVHAGFTTAQAEEVEDAGMPVTTGNLTLAANTMRNGDGFPTPTGAFQSSFGRRLAFLLVVECLVVSVISSWLIGRQAAPNRLMAEPQAFAQRQGSAPVIYPAFAQEARGDANGIEFCIDCAEEAGGVESGDTTGSDKRGRTRDGNELKATRVTALMGGHVKVDDMLCRHAEDGCRELRVSIKSGDDNNLLYFHMHHPRSSVRRDTTHSSAPLAVAHNSGETYSGHIHVTLFTQNRLLLIKDVGCSENDTGNVRHFAGNSLDGFSRGTTADVQVIGEAAETRVEQQGTGAAEKETRLFRLD